MRSDSFESSFSEFSCPVAARLDWIYLSPEHLSIGNMERVPVLSTNEEGPDEFFEQTYGT